MKYFFEMSKKIGITIISLCVVLLSSPGCNPSTPQQPKVNSNGSPIQIVNAPLAIRPGIVYEEQGIEVKTIMLSANDYMLDFRFKVLDAEKAKSLFGKDKKPILIDHASGATLIVPAPPKVGSLRQTSYEPHQGRIHFILFANPHGLIKRGNAVTVVIGNFRAENLIVE